MVTETFQPEGFFSKEVASFEKKVFFIFDRELVSRVLKIYLHHILRFNKGLRRKPTYSDLPNNHAANFMPMIGIEFAA